MNNLTAVGIKIQNPFKKNEEEKFSKSLRNFLYYLLDFKYSYKSSLNNDYTSEEKNTFIYNCAINTINEVFYSGRYYKSPETVSGLLMDTFIINFNIRDFEESEIDLQISEKSLEIINLFEYLKKDLSKTEIDGIKAKAENIASV